MLPNIPEERTTYTGKTMREALEGWVARHTPVSPRVDGRWLRDDESAPSPALREATSAARPTP
jgi:hypothetical protein